MLSVDVWSEVCAMAGTADFDPNQRLISVCLSLIKIGGDFSKDLYELATLAVCFCRRAIHLSDQTFIEYIGSKMGNE